MTTEARAGTKRRETASDGACPLDERAVESTPDEDCQRDPPAVRYIELLNALRATQAEHSRTLAEHGQMLSEHSRMHAEHSRRFDAIDGRLGELALGMHRIESLPARAHRVRVNEPAVS